VGEIRLSFAITPYDRVLPLLTGEIKPSGITLESEPFGNRFIHNVPRIFYDQIKFQRYDVSEMSFSSFLIERAKGWPYYALPVFHNRNFRYANMVIRRDAGIRQDHPQDLKGKRFSIPDYQMTMGLWTRGILQHEFGIRPEDMHWLQTRGERFSLTGISAKASNLPSRVKLTFANTEERDLFERGEADASITVGTDGLPDAVTLFSNPKAEAIRFYNKTGIYPPHHVTVVRESIVREHPWVALSLLDAFQSAKDLAIQRLANQTLLAFGEHYVAEERAMFGPDPFAYGVKVNANAIDMAQTISVEQGLTTRKASLDELFPEEILIADEAKIMLR
jgi:4,5-dihydroxyphthalate decarboxylase